MLKFVSISTNYSVLENLLFLHFIFNWWWSGYLIYHKQFWDDSSFTKLVRQQKIIHLILKMNYMMMTQLSPSSIESNLINGLYIFFKI